MTFTDLEVQARMAYGPQIRFGPYTYCILPSKPCFIC